MSKRYKRYMISKKYSSNNSSEQNIQDRDSNQINNHYFNKQDTFKIQNRNGYQPQLTLVQNLTNERTKSKQQRIKQIEKIDQQLRLKSQKEQQRDNQQHSVQMLKNPQYIFNKKQYKILQKQYSNYSYLPYQYLKQIKKILTNYENSNQCRFQKDNQNEDIHRIRQEQRLKLTKSIIFSIFQIIQMLHQFQMKQIQKQFSSSQLNKLQFSYTISRELQSSFFKKLFRKSTERKMKEPYRQQISMIIRLFSDKNNLQFKRKILNREYDLSLLAQEKQDNLQSTKSKEQKFKLMSQIVRQNQKMQTSNDKIQEEVLFQKPSQPQLQISINSFRSVSQIGQKQNISEKRKREKQQLILKNKLICKKGYTFMMKTFRRMSENINKLKYLHIKNKSIGNLKNLLEI